ncbi:helix-turn-helix domain-containing protein [Pedobacter paludis]|uniref:HTH araC/xylS-type domain-containing protein n=1 Tax=Pedobacter paludis TaxID=2203212 RepID=A0A317EZ83_9SPHI|nr:helix-turn-helix domain-containing protein [Pedobacter paludis]PWS32201.1 hypothetical protein DF947_10555 [Pedobacter paludis]
MRLTFKEAETLTLIKKYIEDHPVERLSLVHLEDSFQLNRSKMIKGFKLMYGESIMAYHLTIRMNHALEILKSGVQVKELAIAMEYSSSSSFARAFRRIHGHPPEHFRYFMSLLGIGIITAEMLLGCI